MSDVFRIVPPTVRAEGKDVPPENIQAGFNSICQQATVALNSVAADPTGPASGDLAGFYPAPTVVSLHVTSGNAAGVAITTSTIDSSVIGGTTPAAGHFTTVDATTPVAVTSGGTGRNALTANAVIIGEGSSQVNFASPAAAGTLLASNGVAADPTFQTKAALTIASSGINSDITSLTGLTTALSVGQGGTGRQTLTNHGVLVGAAAAAISQTAAGTTGQMLLGVTGADPAFGNNPTITGGTIDGAVIGGTTPAAGTFTNLTASGTLAGFAGRLLNTRVLGAGTYTPTAGTNSVIVEVVGGGGAGGGAAANNGSGGGGGSGSFARARFTSAFSGVTVTLGAAGTPGAAGANNGGAGGTTTFGALVSCPGGGGGTGTANSVSASFAAGGAAGVAPTISGGTPLVSTAGTVGSYGQVGGNGNLGGAGAFSFLGSGGTPTISSGAASSAGATGSGNGSGGSGASAGSSGSAQAGGAGVIGAVIVYEYS